MPPEPLENQGVCYLLSALCLQEASGLEAAEDINHVEDVWWSLLVAFVLFNVNGHNVVY